MAVHTIILTAGQLTAELKTVCDKKQLYCAVKSSTYESASEASFNESKFVGTVCLKVSEGQTVVLPNAEDFMTKKGTLQLQYNLTTRIPSSKNENYKFILVIDDTNFDSKSKEFQLVEWCKKNGTIMTLQEFSDYEIPKTVLPKPHDVKVTTGLLTNHQQFGQAITGHRTLTYNVTVSDGQTSCENNAMHINKIYQGQIIKLTIDDGKTGEKDCGHIVMIPDLGPTAHITVKTSIKSSVSGPVLEKYNSGVYEFNLQDVDPASKQNPKIKVSNVDSTLVMITGTYTYATESFNK